VWQPSRSTLIIYSEAGRFEKSLALPGLAGTGVSAPRTLHVDPQGNIAIETYRRAAPPGRAVARIAPDGQLIDIVASPDGLPATVRQAVTGSGAQGRVTLAVPYASRSLWAWSPRGYWVTGFSGQPSFEIRAPVEHAVGVASPGATPKIWRPGDPIVSVRWDNAPIEVSAAERSAQAAYLLVQAGAVGATVRGPVPEIPGRKPAYRRLIPDSDGRIWVEVSVPSERVEAAREPEAAQTTPGIGWREPSVYQLFDPSGALLGRIDFPWGVEPIVMKGNHVWGKATDATGVETVKRFRIEWRR
jgi:hypothetical protein